MLTVDDLAQPTLLVTIAAFNLTGAVDTHFTDASINAQSDPSTLRVYANGLYALNRMARPDEVAEAMCWLLSERASITTGSKVFVDGGYMIKR
ncbi:MAG: SDR family oxidoreductase [Chloroflexota bacterium]|nr:SDR family oxidoreductase [Chloroflexota bacterium]